MIFINTSIFSNFEQKINKLSKNQLQKLYNYITEYFDNCEKYGLEQREGQYNMALSVYDVIESLEHLVIEAGVGIGKSYAYLIPLLYYHKITNKPFIISTSTIALQEQLEKDVKKLSQQLNISLEIVVAKGMSNFMCLNRLDNLSKHSKDIHKQLNREKQDRKDYPNIPDKLWKNVCVDSCLYGRCKNIQECEFYNRREEMRTTNGAIICNHDLLIMDLSRKNEVYGKPLFNSVDYIVCDESHNLENKVRNFKTRQLEINSIKGTISKSIDILRNYKNYEYDYKTVSKIVDDISQIIDNNVLIKLEQLRKKGIDLIDCNGLELTIDSKIISLSKQLISILYDISDLIQMHTSIKIINIEEEINDKIEMIEALATADKGEYLFWIEHTKNKNHIYYAPKKINKIAHNLFFDEFSKKTFIFTSATLSVGENDYSYFLKSIGGDIECSRKLTTEYSYESPYDYDKNTILYCCNDIEDPTENKEKYLNQLVQKIKELILLTKGKALVLFTSKNDMNYVYSKIGRSLGNINIYVQNDGSSQDIVKNKFKNEINSVLFSTGIFWEGIDIKGNSLSNLIIARLPFPIVDPIMEYKKSLYGKEGFKQVYLPEMLIKLKQGVGRLIRCESDTGIVCILDSRMNDKYKDIIRDAIPIKNITNDIEDAKKLVKKYNIDK